MFEKGIERYKAFKTISKGLHYRNKLYTIRYSYLYIWLIDKNLY